MKKLLSIFAVVAVLFAVSCGAGAATPTETAVKFYELVANGEYEAAVEHLSFHATSPEEVEQGKAMIVSLLSEKSAPMLEKKGGLKSIEPISETISEDGKSAKVELKIIYGNGTEEKQTGDMILTESGDWKLKLNK